MLLNIQQALANGQKISEENFLFYAAAGAYN